MRITERRFLILRVLIPYYLNILIEIDKGESIMDMSYLEITLAISEKENITLLPKDNSQVEDALRLLVDSEYVLCAQFDERKLDLNARMDVRLEPGFIRYPKGMIEAAELHENTAKCDDESNLEYVTRLREMAGGELPIFFTQAGEVLVFAANEIAVTSSWLYKKRGEDTDLYSVVGMLEDNPNHLEVVWKEETNGVVGKESYRIILKESDVSALATEPTAETVFSALNVSAVLMLSKPEHFTVSEEELTHPVFAIPLKQGELS